MAGFEYSMVTALVVITVSALPISRIFQWWSPPSDFIFYGGLSSIFSLPLTVRLFTLKAGSSPLLSLAMFFSVFMFASSIDLVLSLENDGIIANYMAFYMKTGEPYLGTPYSTAICYWDGVIHYILYWLMLYSFSQGLTWFRSVSLYWFGTFYLSIYVLLLGSLSGPFEVTPAILLNVPYVILPVLYIFWLLHTIKHHQTETVQFSTSVTGAAVRAAFTLMFFMAAIISIMRSLVALGANRNILNDYGRYIEQPIADPYNYPKVTMLMYVVYGVPFYFYAMYCLVTNTKTLALVDLSMVYAGLAANAQVGYIGPYMVPSAESTLVFAADIYWFVFWFTNVLMFIVPHLFAVYCYNFYPSAPKSKLK